KWIAFSRPDVSRSSDIYLVPAAGGEARKVTFDSLNEVNPQFSADSKKLYFVRIEGDSSGSERPGSQLYCTPLERLDKDPEDADPEEPEDADPNGPPSEFRRGRPGRVATPSEPKIDWDGLKRRTRQVVRGNVRVSSFIPARDGRTIVFVGSEGAVGRGGGG